MDMTLFTDSMVADLIETALTALPFAAIVIAIHVIRRRYNRLIVLNLVP